MIGEGRLARQRVQTAARTMIWGGGGDVHRSASFRPPKPERANRDKFRKPSGMACSRFPHAIFSGDSSRFGISTLYAMMKILEGDGPDRAGVIGLIRQGFASVGLEADQIDHDRVSSDQGFLIGRSGWDRSDQGQLSSKFRKLSHSLCDIFVIMVFTYCQTLAAVWPQGKNHHP